MEKLTREQVEALKAVYDRHVVPTGESSYLSFRRTAWIMFDDCLMVPVPGMTIGIERDGYTHT